MVHPTVTHRFAALGTVAEGGSRAEAEMAQRLWRDVAARVAVFETQFSRFQPDSELSRLNANAGRPSRVSEEMLRLLEAARQVYAQTDGLVDPSVGQAVIAAGYDTSFDQIGRRAAPRPVGVATPLATLADIVVHETARTVLVPAGVALDFGGVGKGYLLDQLAPMISAVTKDYWFSLGGDLVASGTDENGFPWSIGVQDPAAPERDLAQIQPSVGHWGMATSGTTKRRGVQAGVPWHHIIHPRTGRPAATDVVAATALAPTALEAEAIAKAVLIQGSVAGLAWVKEQASGEVFIVSEGGRTMSTPGLKSFLTIL